VPCIREGEEASKENIGNEGLVKFKVAARRGRQESRLALLMDKV